METNESSHSEMSSDDPRSSTTADEETGSTGSVLGRRRAQSVHSFSSVETVVVKAKRAASSLWMLLHSQNCAVASCPHQGCQEAKRLHLHIKTCAAGSGFDCPSCFPGCDKARKLLAHYHRCRTTRARQAGQIPSRRDAGQNQCLVCSLVARQARTVLERNSVIRLSGSSSASRTVSKKQSSPSSYTLDIPTKVIGNGVDSPNSSEEFMPPPPPRPAANASLRGAIQAGVKLKHQCLSSPCANSAKTPLLQADIGGSFDTAGYQYRQQQSSVSSSRDRSLSVNKDAARHVNTNDACMAGSGLHRRRRSASVGCVPFLGAPPCGTIEEEDAVVEGIHRPPM